MQIIEQITVADNVLYKQYFIVVSVGIICFLLMLPSVLCTRAIYLYRNPISAVLKFKICYRD